MNDLEKRIQDLERELRALKEGVYNFSDRQEWTKKLKISDLEINNNFNVGGNLVVTGSSNLKGGIQTNGTPGATTAFSTSGAFTVTVQDGLIISVV